ncbi:hypothetical protein J7K27_07350 [Candidatus Bathyarchaeota archaeon]|nr:hypothetical protein [Candidatus Bathyarchaeota archaeon]
MIEQPRRSNRNRGIRFVNCDIMNFERQEKFDLVFSIRAFE